jgi:hypothetical protein
MNNSGIYTVRSLVFFSLMIGLGISQPSQGQTQKLKIDELVSKHLEAIGAVETRESNKTRIISGTVVVTFRVPGTGQVGGRVVLASEGAKNLLGMVFDNSVNSSQEQLAFDGNDVSGSYIRPGARSTLGDFVLTHKAILRQGLIGGVLSQAWPLFDLAGRKAKLEMSGTKKIGDREAYQVKYYPSGGSDLRISLFFDTETFQHVRTEYNRTVAAQIGATPETSSRQSETRYKMVEDFSDFRKEGGLTLPHKSTIELEVSSQRGSFKAQWDMTLSQFDFNQKIDPATFKIESK